MESIKIDFENLDRGIRPAVELLIQNGFKTFESCQGGRGHAYYSPTVRFHGDETELLRAYEICEASNMAISCVRRVYSKESWHSFFNEIEFFYSMKTGTIFLPH